MQLKKLIHKIWNSSPQQFYQAIKKRLTNTIPLNQPIEKNLKITSGYGKGLFLNIAVEGFGGWKLMLNGAYDNFLFEEINKYYPKDKVIWDIGAHFGYSSLSFSKMVGAGGKVFSFEPNRANIDRFKVNLSLNLEIKNISLLEIALSDRDEKVDFIYSDNVSGSQSTGSHIANIIPPQEENIYQKFNFKKEKVQSHKADTILPLHDITTPDYIKIDVEGAENLVLLGAENLIKDYKPILFIEVHNVLAMLDVVKTLHMFGYDIIHKIDDSDFTISRCFIVARVK